MSATNIGNIDIYIVGGCNNLMQAENNFILAQRKALFALISQLQQYQLEAKHNRGDTSVNLNTEKE